MYPVTDRFIASLSQSHVAFGQIDFLIDGQLALSSQRNTKPGVFIGSRESGVQITDASVAVAAGIVRRIANQITIVDTEEDLADPIGSGLLVVGQSEIRLWSGIQYWDATPGEIARDTDTEQVPIITGPITDVNLEDYPIITLTASDRGWYLLQEFSSTYSPTSTQTLDDALLSLLRFKVPTTKLETNIPSTELRVGAMTFDENTQPADAAGKMATAASWALYCDPMGVFIAGTEPELRSEDVVQTYEAGDALIKPRKKYSADQVKNTWVVTGEAPAIGQQATPYGKVVDNDPSSPTYVRAPYDERPRFIHNPLATTDAQCVAIAKTYRARERGLAFSYDVDVYPNPARERGDVLLVDDHRSAGQLVIADSFTAQVPARDTQPIVGRVGALSTDD